MSRDIDTEARFDAGKSIFPALAVFLVVVVVAGAWGGILFDRYEREAKVQATQDLAGTGRLRANQLSAFLKERKGDARIASGLLRDGLAQSWWQGGDKKLPAMPRRTLDSMLAEYGYTGAMILDTRGNIRFSGGRSVGLSDAGKSMALRALGKASPVFSELYFADPAAPRKLVLDTFAPVMSADGAKAVGILVLRGDWDYLFSTFQPWPDQSRSAEYLLVRQDGAEVLFLNQLRYQEQAANRLRMPLTGDVRSPGWPAIRAVQGHYGAMESIDYRGKHVFSYSLPVPDTGWSMVVKEDVAEVLAGIRRVETAAIFSFLVLATLAFALWWWWLRSRRRAGQALRESRERFEKAFQASPDSITLVTLEDGTFVEVNDSFERFTGYRAAEAMGRNARDLDLWMDPAQREFIFAELRAGRRVNGIEARIRRKDGEMRVGLRFATRVEIGGVPHVLSIMRDITKTKLAEQALLRERDFAAGLIEAAPAIIVMLDLEGRIKHVNPYFEKLAGYRLDEVRGKNWFETFLPERDRERIRALFGTAAQGVPTRGNVNPIVTRDGEEREIEWHDQVVRDEQGNIATLLAIGQDVTERRKMEQALLIEHAAIESSTNAIAMASPEGKLIYVNRAFLDLWKLDKPEQVLGRSPAEFWEQPGQAIAVMERVLREASWQGELRALRHDGSTADIQVSASAVRDDRGQVVCIMASFVDITVRKRAEETIRELNAELEGRVRERTAQLETANKELETFSYSVAHDLKAPLRGIDGYSRLLLAGYSDKLDEQGRQFLRNVRQAAQQMGQLINDLLVYSRLERRDMQADKVDPQALIRSLLAEYADEIRTRGVALSVDVSCTSVTADRDGLVMALRNLIDNALKFTRNAPKPTIEISARDTDTTCILSVRDNGLGFDMKYHDRIFVIFQRLHRSEDYPGTGIGLAIVNKAMERMGGRAWAESEPDKGATFYLEIPE
jgi:PAS domain S-box-containing protein